MPRARAASAAPAASSGRSAGRSTGTVRSVAMSRKLRSSSACSRSAAAARGFSDAARLRGGVGRKLDQALQAPVRAQQLGGALLADSTGPRQAVGRVAAQGDEVRDLLRIDAVAAAHLVCFDERWTGPAAREQDGDGVADALEHVAVAGEQQRAAAGGALGGGQRRRAGRRPRGRPRRADVPAERAEEAARVAPLVGELVGHRRAIGVVGRIGRRAVGRGLRAEAEDDGPRVVLLDGLQQQVGRSEQRVDRPAVGVGDRLRQGEERAVEQRRRVDGEQRGGHERPLCQPRRLDRRTARPREDGRGTGRLARAPAD